MKEWITGNEGMFIRPMTPWDIGAGMRLKRQAGWNQTYDDWRRFLAIEPGGCFVAEWGGRTAGTLTYCLFRPVAWIAMMLVDPQARGRGMATRLMNYVLSRIDSAGIAAVRLDATPMARPLYEKLGFRPQSRILRYGGTVRHMVTAQPSLKARDFRWSDWHQVRQLDVDTVGVDRTKLLKRLFLPGGGHGRVISLHGTLAGYLTARPGSLAVQIGPVVATSNEVGRTLLVDALQRHRHRPIFLDVPVSNEAARAALEAAGLKIFREFTRMCRGQPWSEVESRLWAGSGPEKG